MKKALLIGAAAVGLALGGAVAVHAAKDAGSVAAPASGAQRKVDNFQLTDHTRYAHDLYYYKYAPAVVLMSQTNGSKVSRDAAAELQKLAVANPGVKFFMLNSNLGESRDAIAAEAQARGFSIPVLVDEQQLVGEQLGVQREGEVFVLDTKSWKVAYHGPVAKAGEALAAVVAGQPVKTAAVPVAGGKAIAFPERARAAQFAKISYAETIAPILQEKCVNCHLTGGIGPFTLDSYEKVKGFAPMIRETVRTRRMPPYFADPHIGEFKNAQGLTAEETKALVHWIEAGAPRGEGADPLLANRGKVAPEWPVHLGKPDVIVDLPAFDVPATGLIDYQDRLVANPFTQDTFLRAISIKPGDRRVLHHVISNWRADPNTPRPAIPGGSVGSYTPGAEAQVMADGAGAPVPAGGKLWFQMHYTTFGKPSTDKTQVGFYVAKEKPKYIKRSAVIGSFGLKIPAGSEKHTETAYMEFPADAYVYTLYPHAHYRGYSVELKQVTPDGKEKMLLSLPRYDFNWQRDYDPIEPIFVKKGTKLVAKWVYNNSKHHFANPDPTIDVTWGEQSHEEMMYFRVNYRFADETIDQVRNDLQDQLMVSTMIGGMDKNGDGKVQASEMTGPLAMMKSRMALLDANKDGALDAKEFAPLATMMAGGGGFDL